MQRAFAAEHDRVVTEGRDQGTVAFADADVKFYLTAAPAERARRRAKDLADRGMDVDIEHIRRAIEDRDKSDQERAAGPLRPAKGAVVLDTTSMHIEDVVERVYRCVEERCLRNR
jgi:cytidylate kinase